MKKICMISFGDLEKPRNGYTLRCLLLALRLQQQGNHVEVYQFSANDQTLVHQNITIHSLEVQHEKAKGGILTKILSFDPINSIRFPVEGYWKLRKLKAELSKFDEFYIEGCLLLNAFLFAKQTKKHVVVDTHCINKEVALKIRKKHFITGSLRAWIWHALESFILTRSDRVIAISEHDEKLIEKYYKIPTDKIDLIPHSVNDADAKKYTEEAAKLKQRFSKGYNAVACFMGDLGAIQNIECEKYIRTVLAIQTPNIHYILVGNNPQKHESKGNITYTGFVDAFDPYILMADFCIAPMAVGSGVKTKLLDYMKYEKPIIATSVAVEGLTPDRHTKICDLKDFTNHVKEFAGMAV
jgi:glycosyltransferase involved in cell wall biosynthesis